MSTELKARIREIFSNPLARIGSVTAVFSLIAGVYGGWHFVSSRLDEHRAVNGFLASAAIQRDAGDYPGAWGALEKASSLDATSAQVQLAQEDVAMRWLEDVHLTGTQTFSEITEKLKPVLTRGVTSTKSLQRQADLLAHLGWSYFLERRESPSGPDPSALYREALQKDPANPYAHAMLGHWLLWNRGSSAEANAHFTAALASRPDVRPFVRRLQLSLRIDGHSSADDEEAIRVANAIRKEHGTLGSDESSSILAIYRERMMPPGTQTPAFLRAVPAADNLATFDWLIANAGPQASGSLSQRYERITLLQATGHRKEALAGYRALAKQLGPNESGTLQTSTQDAIDRLTSAVVR